MIYYHLMLFVFVSNHNIKILELSSVRAEPISEAAVRLLTTLEQEMFNEREPWFSLSSILQQYSLG